MTDITTVMQRRPGPANVRSRSLAVVGDNPENASVPFTSPYPVPGVSVGRPNPMAVQPGRDRRFARDLDLVSSSMKYGSALLASMRGLVLSNGGRVACMVATCQVSSAQPTKMVSATRASGRNPFRAIA